MLVSDVDYCRVLQQGDGKQQRHTLTDPGSKDGKKRRGTADPQFAECVCSEQHRLIPLCASGAGAATYGEETQPTGEMCPVGGTLALMGLVHLGEPTVRD